MRTEFERRFGADFTGVRVHTGSQAESSARSLNALAYTAGRHIAFGPGQYAPHTDAGRKMLAHELAHVAQQPPGAAAGTHFAADGLAVSDPSDPLEHEAEKAAAGVTKPSRGGAPTTGAVRRQTADQTADPGTASRDAGAAGDEGHNPDDQVEWISQMPQASGAGAPGSGAPMAAAGAGGGAGGPATPAAGTDAGTADAGGAAPSPAGAGGGVAKRALSPEITLETGNNTWSPINNALHQQICLGLGGPGKQCFSFAANGVQAPEFSSTWLGWSSTVVGAVLKGEVYTPMEVPSATIAGRRSLTPAQAANWLRYMNTTRVGLSDGYSALRHNCRLFSQWEFRDAPSHF